jgi:hypothetical protein
MQLALSDGKEEKRLNPFLFILLLAPGFMPPQIMASTQCHLVP